MEIAIINQSDRNIPAVVIPVIQNAGISTVLDACRNEGGIGIPEPNQFKADWNEVWPLYIGEQRFFLLGLGPNPGFSETLKAFRSFAHKFRLRLSSRIGLSLLHRNAPENPAAFVEAAANGLALSAYRIGKFKTSNGDDHPLAGAGAQITLLCESGDNKTLHSAATRGLAIADTQMSMYDLVNAPANKKVPEDLKNWALASAKKYGYKAEALDKAQLQELGLHALLAVNQGSANTPYLIITEYRPVHPTHRVALVGKGVTFDTGGLSIKPSASMSLMKSDMGGAAAVLGAVEVAARQQLPVHVIGIIPATENSVDANSFCPSDVIGSYSGKTIEVIDTDAEGRLVLADGLFYAVKHFQPDILIDLATLTGATVRTLGSHAAGLFSNNERLATQLEQAGDRCGERLWRFPLWDSYKDEIKSDVADVRNLGIRPTAGAIAAAKFLEVFIDNHPNWAHLDIAGVAFGDSEFASQKSATAYGVRLLLDYLTALSHQ
ncbi:MAG: leucyl aminopeptidase [Saprospiraceae bacterium]|nr:leucyl aminopeptidase [Saprospiraceae bacterium]